MIPIVSLVATIMKFHYFLRTKNYTFYLYDQKSQNLTSHECESISSGDLAVGHYRWHFIILLLTP